MKKAFLIAALFAVAGIAGAQNTSPVSAASAPAVKPEVTTGTAKPAEGTPKAAQHKKVRAKHVKHTKHAAKKGAQAKTAGTESMAKTDAAAPAK